jgi:hypothetical protein
VSGKSQFARFAKVRWKEGLSQALLYAHRYKAVICVLFAYSSGAKYSIAFGRGDREESRFARRLSEFANIHIVVLKPSSPMRG